MQRIVAALSASMVAVLLLAGCSSTNVNWAGGSSDLPDVNLKDTASVQALCGGEAETVLNTVSEATTTEESSGQRNALTSLGLSAEEVNDNNMLTEIIGALKVRAADNECAADEQTSNQSGQVGVEENDGTQFTLPLVSGSDSTLIVDSTTQAATPPLLDGSLRFTAQTLTWEGLVQRVGNQQWYIDGINARAAQTGFTWDDVLRFASVNRMKDGKVDNSGVNALAIQIFNRPDLTDDQARAEVAKYITPEVEKVINVTVYPVLDQSGNIVRAGLPIQRINNGFINTMNVGSKAEPSMGNYFDTQRMVRVSLMPITFDDAGKAVSLDGSRGAGIFIDCGNLHWVPKAVWYCKSDSCEKPQCPMGTIGTPPNCSVPTPPTPTSPPSHHEECVSDCLEDKDWDKSPQEDGWVPLDVGPLTDGRGSQAQLESGETSGNVIDNPVAEDTKTGDTTTDLPSGTITAPGATDGGDDPSQGEVDEENTNGDEGGTDGDTCVPDVIAGITC
ncbi:MAG: hypothetical protein WAR37_01245 [Candidatus Microsaccharimonas sp.]